MTNRIVILGAGIAGLNAVKELRRNGFTGSIALVDQDNNLPYDRPPLSKEFFRGEFKEADILLEKEKYYKDNDIDLYLGEKVVDIEIPSKSILFENGERLQWNKLLIATGCKVRRLNNIRGCELDGIHYLKSLKDARRLQEKVSSLKRIAIVGAGFIGLEVAASCRNLGIDVTVIETSETPLARVLGSDMGEVIAGAHRSKGVKLITGEVVKEFQGVNKVDIVVTSSNKYFDCDAVLVGIGVFTDMTLAGEYLDHNNNGYIVDAYCETSVPDIFAAGDCAEWQYPISGDYIRIEHWDHAMNQGICAANNMLNPRSAPYSTVPYFWSDQYDMSLQYFGHVTKWDKTVIRGNVEELKFTQFYISNNKVEGALIINDAKSVLPTRKLISQGIEINSEELADINIDLKKLSKKVRNN